MEFEKLQNIIVETIGCDAELVKPEAKLIEDLGADSLAAVELMMALEEALDITISDEDAQELTTVQAIMDYIAKAVA